MNGLLVDSARAYKALLSVKYRFTIARKRTLIRLTMSFPIEGYHHLAGFQYAGVVQLRNRKEALGKVLSGEITASQLQAAGTYNSIADRLTAITLLPVLLEQGRLIFHYRGHEQKWSDIRADYLASMELGDSFVCYFTAEDRLEQVPVSIFIRPDKDYMKFCPSYKVLQVEKEDLLAGTSEVVYRSPSFRE